MIETVAVSSADFVGNVDDARWRAVLGRDPRADGRFVYAVRTTGIYCRPVCPARRPQRRNVIFFTTAGSAADGGFRACKRCQPDAGSDEPREDRVALRSAAILFADAKGFTRLTATMRPRAALALASELQGRLAAAVGSHGGVVHKFLGDGLMAVFGAEHSRANDAARALAAALDMAAGIAGWNRQRAARGAPALGIGVGVHFGPVAIDMIGRAGEHAIIGDTVNVASRLERATRRLGTSIAVSEETLRALDDRHASCLRSALACVGSVRLRGCRPRRVWTERPTEGVRCAA